MVNGVAAGADRVIEAGGVTARMMLGDCRERMREIPDASVDCVVADPPYPCIKRSYGYWTEEQWHDLMRAVVGECRRILKPRGSAVFILQPNSERVGRMRPWLWEFMAWTAREWNQVQDVWWWNTTAIPEANAIQGRLMRPSLKACVWLGPEDCYRDQGSILWSESAETVAVASHARYIGRRSSPSGHGMDTHRAHIASLRRGGVTPYNLFPIPQTQFVDNAGRNGHGAGTPPDLCDSWLRYLCPSGGVVCDPFCGSGTTGLVALSLRRSFIGIESDPGYFALACDRLSGPPLPLFDRPAPVVPDDRPLFRKAAPGGGSS